MRVPTRAVLPPPWHLILGLKTGLGRRCGQGRAGQTRSPGSPRGSADETPRVVQMASSRPVDVARRKSLRSVERGGDGGASLRKCSDKCLGCRRRACSRPPCARRPSRSYLLEEDLAKRPVSHCWGRVAGGARLDGAPRRDTSARARQEGPLAVHEQEPGTRICVGTNFLAEQAGAVRGEGSRLCE